MFSAGLDAPGVYHGVSAGGLDVRQLADAGEEFFLPLVLYLICCDVSLLLNTGVFIFVRPGAAGSAVSVLRGAAVPARPAWSHPPIHTAS